MIKKKLADERKTSGGGGLYTGPGPRQQRRWRQKQPGGPPTTSSQVKGFFKVRRVARDECEEEKSASMASMKRGAAAEKSQTANSNK